MEKDEKKNRSEAKQNRCRLLELPSEIISQIARQMDGETLTRFSLTTSAVLCLTTNDRTLWATICRREGIILDQEESKDGEIDWRFVYIKQKRRQKYRREQLDSRMVQVTKLLRQAPCAEGAAWYEKLLSRNKIKEYRVAISGLEGAGKTTMRYTVLRDNQPIVTIPGMGSALADDWTHGQWRFTMWDAAQPLFKLQYIRSAYSGKVALIWVVSSIERDTIMTSREELYKILDSDEWESPFVLVLCSKAEVEGTKPMSIKKIEKKLGLRWRSDIIYHLQRCSTSEEYDGIPGGMFWLKEKLLGVLNN